MAIPQALSVADVAARKTLLITEGSITHHSSMDTYDHAIGADLMQASAVIATVVYEAANRTEMLPRRELPRAESRP